MPVMGRGSGGGPQRALNWRGTKTELVGGDVAHLIDDALPHVTPGLEGLVQDRIKAAQMTSCLPNPQRNVPASTAALPARIIGNPTVTTISAQPGTLITPPTFRATSQSGPWVAVQRSKNTQPMPAAADIVKPGLVPGLAIVPHTAPRSGTTHQPSTAVAKATARASRPTRNPVRTVQFAGRRMSTDAIRSGSSAAGPSGTNAESSSPFTHCGMRSSYHGLKGFPDCPPG